MAPQNYFWPTAGFAPGDLAQSILPGWFSNVSVNYQGNADIEKEVIEKVASYGKQLGIITDALLVLAGDDPPSDDKDPVAHLRKIAGEVRELKERNKRSLTEQATDAMTKLAESNPREAERIGREFARKGGG